ncbi:MAG: pyridoxal phosphate-dependent aminotransferase [Geothrix sp.]|uniref:pyridoxal phosphate-dependent aminotransferase n=1 Tax=Geothrix sp. TaxID=1962974 RepID=UPI0017A4AC68|nr:pyridoxal phosphate-dependent aminotransferase [Geothrix sp.]NWJ40851.1 pyridoxal phosphate-dependent aminotransferase [Geothrix sp.]WIL21148.1 MAG: pyridoxal phosphate-dependent aminotransferase [Geothrix sp.]
MTDQLIPTRRAFPADDPIFALNAEAQARKATGESILNATVGALLDESGQLVVLDSVMDLWRELTALEVAPYAPIAGDPTFLNALVQRHWPSLRSAGAACATPGGSGAISLSMRNFLEAGQKVLTTAPYWGPYATMAAENGLSLVTAPWPEANQALDAAAWTGALQALLRDQGRALIILNDPCHNPTGRSLSVADRRAFADLLRTCSALGPITLLLDFAYLDYTRDPAFVAAALADYAVLGAEGRILVGASMSLSKSMTLYGARCGALAFPWCTDPALQAALTQSCRGTWSNCAKAPQALLLRLAKEGKAQERLAAEHRHWSDLLSARATALDAALVEAAMPPVHWMGGFFVCVSAPDPEAVCTQLKAQGVFTVPLPEGLRVGLCGLRASEAPRFAQALRQVLSVR